MAEIPISKSVGRAEHSATACGLVIINPVAGEGNSGDVKKILQSLLGSAHYHLYETSGDEDLPEVVRTAVRRGEYSWVAAVGGDGTVSQVADGLIKSEIPLIIIPRGTGNVLAQALGIPLDTQAACKLIVSDASTIRQLDSMRVNGQHFFLQIGIGLEAVTMQNTSSQQKNRWGLFAYLWTAVKEAFGWQPHHFTLTIDGRAHYIRASELVIANAREIGMGNLAWREDIVPDDGKLDIAVLYARSLMDYMRVVIALFRGKQKNSGHIQFFAAHEKIGVEAKQRLPIHGDGEVLNSGLPFEVTVVPGALGVIVPSETV